jgi:lambda repressor-like predicted transcriptional regulator
MPKPTMEQIRMLLHRRRYTLRSWAIRHGYNPNTVDKSLRRTITRGTAPRGILAAQIVKRMEKTIERKIVADL